METKLDGILTEDEKDIIVSTLSQVNLEGREQLNLIESVMTICIKYQGFFQKLTTDEQIKAMTLVTLIFETLLDEDINPLAKKHTTKALKVFNNNIVYAYMEVCTGCEK